MSPPYIPFRRLLYNSSSHTPLLFPHETQPPTASRRQIPRRASARACRRRQRQNRRDYAKNQTFDCQRRLSAAYRRRNYLHQQSRYGNAGTRRQNAAQVANARADDLHVPLFGHEDSARRGEPYRLQKKLLHPRFHRQRENHR